MARLCSPLAVNQLTIAGTKRRADYEISAMKVMRGCMEPNYAIFHSRYLPILNDQDAVATQSTIQLENPMRPINCDIRIRLHH